MQFRHSPSQEQANTQQLTLLHQYTQALANRQQVKLKVVQSKFRRKHHQHLIIKKINNDKIYIPRKRGWSEVKNYLAKHPLDNPVTVDFSFTKVTSSQPIVINGEPLYYFSCSSLCSQHTESIDALFSNCLPNHKKRAV